MTYKNWDNVRDSRLYGYMNKHEMDAFLKAMRLRDLDHQATAVRTFVNERSEQIIFENRRDKYKQPHSKTPTVKLPCFYHDNTVTKFFN